MKNSKNNYVYSFRINKEQMELLNKNKNIKEDLNRYVREYLDSFLKEKNNISQMYKGGGGNTCKNQ